MRTHPLWNRFEIPSGEDVAAARVGVRDQGAAPVEVVPYDPAWPEWYAAVRDRVLAALGDRVLAIDHVGSTSVPGLWAKPVIDVDVTVADPADEDAWLPDLEAAGFVLRVREPEWEQHRCLRGTGPTTNLHVFPPGAREPQRHLLFRDWLRSHRDDRDRYAEVKREVAARGFTDAMLYNNEKAWFVYDIYEKIFAADPAHEHSPQPRPASGPPSPQPPAAGHLGPEEFDRWYGGWEPLDPTTIAEFMEGFDRPWWIVGGWSLEAFTGISRDHEDMDISILAGDAEAFRVFLGDRWTAWNVDNGWFRPFDARFTDVRPDSQVWVRRDARSPWVLDVVLTPGAGDRWTNKRHRAHTERLEDVTWVAEDGLRYARPEVTLMFKAAQARQKDRRDAEGALPLLDDRARTWLSEAVARFDPEHPWAVEDLSVRP